MIKWLVLIAILFVILIFAKWMKEIHTFQVTKYEIHSPKLKGVSTRKIVFLSDLHNCSYGKDNEKLLKAVPITLKLPPPRIWRKPKQF